MYVRMYTHHMVKAFNRNQDQTQVFRFLTNTTTSCTTKSPRLVVIHNLGTLQDESYHNANDETVSLKYQLILTT